MKIIRILSVIILVILCLDPPLFASDSGLDMLKDVSGINDSDITESASTQRLSLFNAYTRAVVDTERLRIGRESFMQARARKDQAFAAFLPYISLQGMYILPESTTSTSVPSNTGLSTGVSAYARQNLFSGLSDMGNYQTAESDEKFSRMQLRYDAGKLLLDIANGFYNILSLERNLQNNYEILKLYNRMRDELKRRVALGRSRSSDLLRVDTQVYQIEAQTREINIQLDSLKLVFATLTGISGDYTLEDLHSLTDTADMASRADELVTARWDVRAAEEDLERSNIKLRTAYGGHLPTAFVQGAYSLSHRGPGMDYYAGVGVELPLYSGGLVNARIREAESLRRQTELRLFNIRRTARQEIIDAARSYESSGEELEAFRRAYVSAQNNYRAVSEDYSRDRVTILDVLTSLTTLQSAKNDYEKAGFKRRLNRIWLGVATSEFNGDKIHLLKNTDAKGVESK